MSLPALIEEYDCSVCMEVTGLVKIFVHAPEKEGENRAKWESVRVESLLIIVFLSERPGGPLSDRTTLRTKIL